MGTTLEHASDEYVKLLSYVVDRPPGTIFRYADVERDTDIRMTRRNRDKLRRAITRSDREYVVHPGEGYELATPATAMQVLTHKLMRIDTSVKGAERSQRIIERQFITELPETSRKGVLFLGAVFGALRLAAENGRKLYGKSPRALTTPESIPFPESS